MMSDDRDERIRARAREIWQREGSQKGRENDHLTEAAQEIDAENTGAGPAVSQDTALKPSDPEKGII
ncbi:MAG: DUF2934 domain-containing protein [Methylobacterium sp.]|uniref:DUF2934 domain-containing protein n=1 Tax=Methylobacterium sp. TaxID=409 RepID=UPI0025E38D2B|nr:DUF2934 domain-containing protein [Methylobacterium sp.]MBX9930325.1 DUF2934 domain-containing protein [Methylobacterium sp.]